MKHPKLGICFYPTTIGLIDDNKEYLKHLASRLIGKEQLPCLAYAEPQKALHFLTQEYHADPFLNHCLLSKEANECDRLVSELDLRAIHQEIYNPHRFNEITVLVIDYAMPRLNGLEICRQLRETPIKIIMLTGEAHKDFAVEVFNEGSIDRFILKDTANIMDILVQTIHELQKEYFLDLSERALNKIAEFSRKTLSCLEDSTFVDFFTQLCQTNRITEYYLMDTYGSFLLLDKEARPSWLAVANEDLMLTYANLAEDDHAPATVIAQLKNKQLMPYFYTKEDFTIRPAQWEKYLHPLNILQGKETYYYAHITNPDAYKWNRDQLISYRQFMLAFSPIGSAPR